jgi:hypothetical protein
MRHSLGNALSRPALLRCHIDLTRRQAHEDQRYRRDLFSRTLGVVAVLGEFQQFLVVYSGFREAAI